MAVQDIKGEMMAHFARAIVAAALLATSACGGGVTQIPVQPFRPNAIQTLTDRYSDVVCAKDKRDGTCTAADDGKPRPGSWLAQAENCGAIAGTAPDTDAALVNCRAVRNAMSSDLLLAINYNFNSYSGNILANRAKSNFYIGGVRSGLEAGATLIGGEGVKTVLAALAGLTGTIQSSANEEFYYEQSAPALIQTMEANRKEVLSRIRLNLKLPYRDYPITALVDDLNTYYRAGTMADAISRLQTEAVTAQVKAEQTLVCISKETSVDEARRCLPDSP